MKKNIFILLFFINSLIIAQSTTFQWAKQLGITCNVRSKDISVDNSGNVYTTGEFNGTADFDPGAGTYTIANIYLKLSTFISKLDGFGNFVWAKCIDFNGNNSGTSIATDKFGNVFITGNFSTTVDFDPGPATYTLNSAGNIDIYILKLDPSGNFLWVKNLGGTLEDYSSSISLDNFGNIYTTGYFKGTCDFDPSSATNYETSLGQEDIFISKLDSLGNFVWAKSIGDFSTDKAVSIYIDNKRNIYTTGIYTGPVDFDPGPAIFNMQYADDSDTFILKLDSSGNFIWAKSILSTLYTNPTSDIAVDLRGNVYTTGYFTYQIDLDPGPGIYNLSPSAGGDPAFISKLDSLGNFVWGKKIEGYNYSSQISGKSIALDSLNNVYTTGSFYGIVDFDPGPTTNTVIGSYNSDAYIHMLDSNGNFKWVKEIQGSEWQYGVSIYVDPVYNIYTTGFFQNGTADFDPGPGVFNLTAGFCQTYVHKMNKMTVGIKEYDTTKYNISIYPNPNTGSFKIEIDHELKKGELLIYNSIGQIIYNEEVIRGMNYININGISKGLYNCILLSDKQQIGVSKLIVE